MTRILPLLAICLFIVGCCTKKACDENDSLNIAFYGFDPSEIDTIYTTGYVVGSSFAEVAAATQADTAMPLPGSVDKRYRLARRLEVSGTPAAVQERYDFLSDKYEWRIHIPSVGRTLLIDRYGYTTFKCNRCFPASPKENKKRSLSSCSVNGVSTDVSDISVNK